MSDLNHRARKILAAVVQEYLATGEAVGSRTVTRRHGVDLSPATVRNVMSDLEEAGLLKQPHTSAGRVPTDEGLRFFVDSLLQVRALTPREREELRARYSIGAGEIDQALREVTTVLSDLSQQTVVLRTPRPQKDVLEHLEFLRLPQGAMIAVVVTRSGQVQNKLFHPERPVGPDELERIHNYLNERLSGLTLDQVRQRIADELVSERTAYDLLARRALELSRAALPDAAAGGEVIVSGTARLVEQIVEGAGEGDVDVGRMKQLLEALEEKQVLVSLLERTEQAEGLQVFIGAETKLEGADVSLVAASYGEGERVVGTLGVIGPTRMNYARMIALVDFTAQIVSNLVRERA